MEAESKKQEGWCDGFKYRVSQEGYYKHWKKKSHEPVLQWVCWNVCARVSVCACENVYVHGRHQNKVISCQMLKRAVSTFYNKNETDHCFSLVALILIESFQLF